MRFSNRSKLTEIQFPNLNYEELLRCTTMMCLVLSSLSTKTPHVFLNEKMICYDISQTYRQLNAGIEVSDIKRLTTFRRLNFSHAFVLLQLEMDFHRVSIKIDSSNSFLFDKADDKN